MKLMPYMLDDFLQLYRFKKEMAARYPMPQNAEYFMAVELKNIVLSWLEMCVLSDRYDGKSLTEEIMRACRLPEVQEAVQQNDFVEREPTGTRQAIQEADVDQVKTILDQRIMAGKYRRLIKSILR